MNLPVMISVLMFGFFSVSSALADDVSVGRILDRGNVFRDSLKLQLEGPELVVIPAGEFLMGDLQDEGYSFEQPVRKVVIGRPFAMGRYEVTFEEFDLFCLSTNRPLPNDQGGGRGRKPVINVTWREARDYCAWLSEQTGNIYRLPSEAEWEYAARGGTRSSRFWADGEREACQYANVADESVTEHYPQFEIHTCRDGYPYTAPVGGFQPNAFGLYDILGNVWEWTLDVWHDTYRGASLTGEARSGRDPKRVRRGGSWFSTPKSVRTAVRNGAPRWYKGDDTGFRVLRELKDAN